MFVKYRTVGSSMYSGQFRYFMCVVAWSIDKIRWLHKVSNLDVQRNCLTCHVPELLASRYVAGVAQLQDNAFTRNK
jgi:hypothetical protein